MFVLYPQTVHAIPMGRISLKSNCTVNIDEFGQLLTTTAGSIYTYPLTLTVLKYY